MTKVIGLTGNVAAGKSKVAELFAAWGATVIDADVLVRQLQRPGEPVFDAIVAHFGPGVLQDNGELDRAALRQRILDDSEARRDLEAIVHPAVARRRRELTASAIERGVSLIVADIPLLFEADHPEDYDAVVLVDAPESLRRERLITMRGMDAAEADRLMATQLPSALKRRAADFVIDNDGDLDLLRERALAVWLALEQR